MKRFLLISSLAAAGPSRSAEPQDETARPHPVSAYGKSKLQAEQAVLQTGGPVEPIVVRPPAVYGPRDGDVLTLVKMAKNGWFPRVGGMRRALSMVHVQDLAEGIRVALETADPGRVYYMTDGVVHPVEEVAAAMGHAFAHSVRLVSLPAWVLWAGAIAGELAESVLRRPAALNLERVRQFAHSNWTASDARARRELGYESRYDLVRGMEDTIRWYRSVGWI